MAQIDFDLTREWTPITGLVQNFDATKLYQVQNLGFDTLVAIEAAETPSANVRGCNEVVSGDVWTYEPETGKTLYLRAFNASCSVTITYKGE